MLVQLGLPDLIRLALLAALGAVVLAGCATAAPPPPTSPTDWQGMANQAVYALKGWPVSVQTKPGSFGEYFCKGGRIELGTAGNVRWLLAHELGHHLLGHCGGENFQHEIDANAMAVKVLQVWGNTQEAAALATQQHLLRLAKLRKGNPRPGHDYCAEVADLLKRYPATPDVRPGSECAR